VDGKIYTAGGRVLGVTATGKTLDDAIAKSYSALKNISFEKMQEIHCKILAEIKGDEEAEELYDEFYEKLVDEQQIFEYLYEEYDSISYVENEEQLTMTFWMTK